MQKHGLISIGLLLIFLAGCSDDTSESSSVNSAVPNNYFNESATLQGTIFDALSGNRLTDASLKVTLIRGTTYQTATVRRGTEEFAGDYALSSVPISINSNVTYRIAVSIDGYQDFEAGIAFNAAGGGTLDENYNFLGNIYLFPLGTSANDLKVNVTFNNEPVEGATVLLQARTSNNTITTDSSNIFQASQNGFLGSMNTVTDANGIATFLGTSLVLGGQYRIDVLPSVHNDIPLAQGPGVTVNIGTSSIIQNVVMNQLVPGTSQGLYIVSASNANTSKATITGNLVLVFSRPVTFANEKAVTATLTNATTAVLDASDAPDSGVTGTLSDDGLTLTLASVYSTAPIIFDDSNATTADNGLTVTYSSLFVRLQDTDNSGVIFDVFTTLVDETGNNPSAVVLVTKPF